ncbi:MAG TPA: NAD(P)H-dependent oxidoreductase [Mesorhizobium sp.]
MSVNVAVFVGSLRKASLTRKVAKAAIDLSSANLRCRLIEIGDIAMYNEDLDAKPPAPWERLRRDIAEADAILFLTPEYNRSIPACLKNVLDVGSRPAGKSVWAGKPAGIISVTPYKLGAFGANHALRQALVFLDVPAMQQPEAYIGDAEKLFDDEGNLTNGNTREFLGKFLTAFESWVSALRADVHGFEDFMKLREKIAAAYSNGDAKPLDGIVANEGAATFFPPSGGTVSGAREVAKRYDGDAKSFSAGSLTKLEALQVQSSGNLAFWTGFQDFDGKIGGEHAAMKLRITEVFRHDGETWRLIHRHADPLAKAARKAEGSK